MMMIHSTVMFIRLSVDLFAQGVLELVYTFSAIAAFVQRRMYPTETDTHRPCFHHAWTHLTCNAS